MLLAVLLPSCVSLDGIVGEPGRVVAPMFPQPSGEEVVVTETIRVRGVFDGKGRMYVPKGLGDGSQKENQKALFVLERDGAVLKNVHYRGADGIHIEADDCVIKRCINHDVGEDAVTVEGKRARIEDSCFRGAVDKVIQVNDGSVTLKRCLVDDYGRFVRLNAERGRKLSAVVEDCRLYNGRGSGVKATHRRGEVRASGNRFYGGLDSFQMFNISGGAQLVEEGNRWDRPGALGALGRLLP